MSCNCKRANKLQDEYGVKEEESWSEKAYRYGFKVFVAVLLLLMSVVAVPAFLLVIAYNIVFGKGKPIVLPNFLGKYMK